MGREEMIFEPYGYLSRCFFWAVTPQGHDYWSDIRDKVERYANR